MLIRAFDKNTHLTGVQACLIELQDFERVFDPRMPSGAEIVAEYIPHMLDQCREYDGAIFVAEVEDKVAGFATILTRLKTEDIEDGEIEYGLVSDLVVASEFRRKGIGRKLVEAAESFAIAKEVRWLRIGVLAENHTADNLYSSMGFGKRYVEREKELTQIRVGNAMQTPSA